MGSLLSIVVSDVSPIKNIAMNMTCDEVINLKKKELSELQAHYKIVLDMFGATDEKSKIVFKDVIALEREIQKLEKEQERVAKK
jgi:hypothetical protein